MCLLLESLKTSHEMVLCLVQDLCQVAVATPPFASHPSASRSTLFSSSSSPSSSSSSQILLVFFLFPSSFSSSSSSILRFLLLSLFSFFFLFSPSLFSFALLPPFVSSSFLFSTSSSFYATSCQRFATSCQRFAFQHFLKWRTCDCCTETSEGKERTR